MAETFGRVQTPTIFDGLDRPVFERSFGRNFVIVVEAKPGVNGIDVGTVLNNSDPDDPEARPDLQILCDRKLGNGSVDVCDKGPAPDLGGVPPLSVSSYEDPLSQAAANAFNDFACRFGAHMQSEDACTVDSRSNYRFASPVVTSRTVQFCFEPSIGSETEFHEEDTVLTVRVRDEGGALGDPKQIVIRLPP